MKQLLSLILVFSTWSCATLPGNYLSLDDQTPVSLNEVLRQIENERVIFVGEAHTNRSDHLVQFEVIKYLHEHGKKVAIALEMFPSAMQVVLNSWNHGYLLERNFKSAYYSVWNLPYSYYKRIFRYAQVQSIPLFGINAENTQIGNVAKKGLWIVSEKILKDLKYTDCSKDPVYKELLGFTYDTIDHEMGLPFLCDAQRLRDAIMAYNLLRILEVSDHTVVVILGAAHASKGAVPEMLQRHTTVSYKVLMPKNFGVLLKRTPDRRIADYIWY